MPNLQHTPQKSPETPASTPSTVRPPRATSQETPVNVDAEAEATVHQEVHANPDMMARPASGGGPRDRTQSRTQRRRDDEESRVHFDLDEEVEDTNEFGIPRREPVDLREAQEWMDSLEDQLLQAKSVAQVFAADMLKINQLQDLGKRVRKSSKKYADFMEAYRQGKEIMRLLDGYESSDQRSLWRKRQFDSFTEAKNNWGQVVEEWIKWLEEEERDADWNLDQDARSGPILGPHPSMFVRPSSQHHPATFPSQNESRAWRRETSHRGPTFESTRRSSMIPPVDTMSSQSGTSPYSSDITGMGGSWNSTSRSMPASSNLDTMAEKISNLSYRPSGIQTAYDPRREESRMQSFRARRSSVPDEWYLQLPGDWAEKPVIIEANQRVDWMKLLGKNSQLKFDGSITKYHSWKMGFIECVHSVQMPFTQKMGCLLASLSNTDPFLKHLVDSAIWSWDGYEVIVTTLEKKYGTHHELWSSYHHALDKLPMVIHGQLKTMEDFVLTVTKYFACFQGGGHSLDNPDTFHRLLKKLHPRMKENFTREMERYGQALNVAALLKYVSSEHEHCKFAMSMEDREKNSKMKNIPRKSFCTGLDEVTEEQELDESLQSSSNPHCLIEKMNFSTDVKTSKRPAEKKTSKEENGNCDVCHLEPHILEKCPTFQSWTPIKRREHVVKSRRCYNCFLQTHEVFNCPSTTRCKECGRKHHLLLHESKANHAQFAKAYEYAMKMKSMYPEASSDEDIEGNSAFAMCHRANSGPISLRIVPVWVRHRGKDALIYALLDDGANVTMLDVHVATYLELKGTAGTLTLGVAGGRVEEIPSMVSSVEILSLDGKFRKKVDLTVVPDPVGDLKAFDWFSIKDQWKHLRDVKVPHMDPTRRVEMIIGQDQAKLLVSHEDREQPGDGPVARRGPLGWTISGPSQGKKAGNVKNVANFCMKAKAFKMITTHVYATKASELLSDEYAYDSKWNKDQLLCMERSRTPIEEQEAPSLVFKTTALESKSFKELKELFEKHFDTEFNISEEAKAKTRDEEYALDLMRSSRKKLPSGKYETSVLWRPGEPYLPNNYHGAMRRLNSLLRSKKFQDHADQYHDIILDWIDKDYARIVPPEEERPEKAFYFPHFGVVREDRATTKLRIVMDAAAEFGGRSFNDSVLAGPNLINDLPTVLLRFRRAPYTIGADVKEMFLQCRLPPEDRKYHRFLWKKKPDDPVVEIELLCHVFGVRGSPDVAIFTAAETAREMQEKCPRACEAILESTIMDDVLDSVDSKDEAKRLIEDVKAIYEASGMKIHKWHSNDISILRNIPEDQRSKHLRVQGTDVMTEPEFKTLGLRWSAADDEFTFHNESQLPESHEWTKRKCLSAAASLFDPLGFISPFIVRARHYIQSLWANQNDWEDPLLGEEVQPWLTWIQELDDLPKIIVPRCLRRVNEEKPQKQYLHAFSDASSVALGLSVYLVTTYEDGQVTSELVLARSKIRKKGLSIPRLELEAAVLSAMTMDNVAKLFPHASVHFWTDSSNILYWLRRTKPLAIYVDNRVKKILKVSSLEQWHHVDSNRNAADVASRGSSLKELSGNKQWWHGPDFIKMPEDQWPESPLYEPTAEAHAEEKRCFAIIKHHKLLLDERFSDWRRLVRVTARILRLWQSRKELRNKKIWPQILAPIPNNEFSEAENRIIRLHQQQEFPDLWELLKQGERVPKTNEHFCLRPFFRGEIRIGSRLKLSEHLSENVRAPILIAKKSHLAVLILRHVHENVLYHVGGAGSLYSEVLRKFWIIGGFVLARRVVRECVDCRHANAKPVHQRMGELPDFRAPATERLPPFDVMGVDMAGPFLVKKGRSQEKRYLMLMTCARYRAVHFELCHSLSTDSVLMGLSRFLARRPRPTRIVSDCGTNFVGCHSEMTELWKKLPKEALEKYPDIEWQFNIPHNSHQGGMWEKMVHLAKMAMRRILSNNHQTLTDEELLTVVHIAEGCINNRPIGMKSSQADDPEPLTPAHFLMGDRSTDLAPVSKDWPLGKRYQLIQDLMDQVWVRWTKEVMEELHKTKKWLLERDNPVVGEICILLEGAPRGRWPLCKIMEVHPGRDGLVREVEVLIRGKLMRRPIQKLVPLLV